MMQAFQAWVVFLASVIGVRYLVGESALAASLRMIGSYLFGLPAHLLFVVPAFRGELGLVARKSFHSMLSSMLYKTLVCPSCLGFWLGVAFAPLFPLALHGNMHPWIAGLVAMLANRAWFNLNGTYQDHEPKMLESVILASGWHDLARRMASIVLDDPERTPEDKAKAQAHLDAMGVAADRSGPTITSYLSFCEDCRAIFPDDEVGIGFCPKCNSRKVSTYWGEPPNSPKAVGSPFWQCGNCYSLGEPHALVKGHGPTDRSQQGMPVDWELCPNCGSSDLKHFPIDREKPTDDEATPAQERSQANDEL